MPLNQALGAIPTELFGGSFWEKLRRPAENWADKCGGPESPKTGFSIESQRLAFATVSPAGGELFMPVRVKPLGSKNAG